MNVSHRQEEAVEEEEEVGPEGGIMESQGKAQSSFTLSVHSQC